MRIISNNTSNCHFKALIELIENSEELLIVTPFISSNINIIQGSTFQKIKKMTLVTTLPQLYNEQEKKVNFFLHYISFAKKYNFSLTILIDDLLHGKVYISKTESKYKVIITSANLTQNGLKTNNEWGVFLDDNKTASEIWQAIVTSPNIYKLTPNEVLQYEQIIKSNKTSQNKESNSGYNFPHPTPLISSKLSKATCWLKPLGTKENPIPESELYDDPIKEITFAVKPVGVKEGDIVICYAVHKKHIVSIYIVEKRWFNNTSKNFPFSIMGKNLYPYYGAQWFKEKITIDSIRAKIIEKNQFTITPHGRNDYKRLTLADKMKVTLDYASFVMQEIQIANNRIASSMITD